MKFKSYEVYNNLDSVIFGKGVSHWGKYCFTTLFRKWRSDWILCGFVVIELLRKLCRIGVSSSIVLVASRISFKKKCVDFLADRIQARNLFTCRHVSISDLSCMTWKYPEMTGILVVIYGRDVSWYGHLCCQRKMFWILMVSFTILTYSMVQSHSWEANWFAASQETPLNSRYPKVHYRTHKRPPPVSILGQPNQVHIPTSHLLEIRPNIIHPSKPRSPQWSLSLRFPHQDPIHPPLLTHMRHMPSPSSLLYLNRTSAACHSKAALEDERGHFYVGLGLPSQ